MRITSVVCASVLVLSSLLSACGQRDSSSTPPAGGSASPSATTPSPATPAASAASR